MGAAIFFVLLSLFPVFGHTYWFFVLTAPTALVIVLKHRANIQRLLSGTENKLSFASTPK
jgi:glycerol-3-phosphate acyltransferase PlsY